MIKCISCTLQVREDESRRGPTVQSLLTTSPHPTSSKQLHWHFVVYNTRQLSLPAKAGVPSNTTHATQWRHYWIGLAASSDDGVCRWHGAKLWQTHAKLLKLNLICIKGCTTSKNRTKLWTIDFFLNLNLKNEFRWIEDSSVIPIGWSLRNFGNS